MTPETQRACFEQWMREHIAILYRVANGFAVGADRNDLMQELMVSVWKAIPAFRSDSKPSTFLYRVSHHAAMTWKRSQRNYQRKVEQFAAMQPLLHRANQPSDTEREGLERIYAALQQLPEVDRSLILLALDGISYRDIAQIHALSESNVGVRLSRIKARLAESLKETER